MLYVFYTVNVAFSKFYTVLCIIACLNTFTVAVAFHIVQTDVDIDVFFCIKMQNKHETMHKHQTVCSLYLHLSTCALWNLVLLCFGNSSILCVLSHELNQFMLINDA